MGMDGQGDEEGKATTTIGDLVRGGIILMLMHDWKGLGCLKNDSAIVGHEFSKE